MTTYISILRGINVSGHKIIKMDDLRIMYEQLNFKNAKTFIQSGNVVFQCDCLDTQKLADKIAIKIKQQFNFDIPVLVLALDAFKAIFNNNPFVKNDKINTVFLHITFLFSMPTILNIKNIDAENVLKDEMFISKNAVYLFCPNGYGNTKFSNNFLEKYLGVKATTRNFKTANELLKIAEAVLH